MAAGKRISFGIHPNGSQLKWVATSTAECERRSRSAHFRAVERIEFAAQARMNAIGHAVFNKDELRDILGRELEPGAWKIAGRSTVADAIKAAQARGTLEVASTARCLVVPRHVSQTTEGTSKCPMHGISLANNY